MKSHVGPSVELSAIVIRACDVCEGKRELGKPCDTCGNRAPAVVTDLGVIASNHETSVETSEMETLGLLRRSAADKENK